MQILRKNDTVPKRAEKTGETASVKKGKIALDTFLEKGMRYPVTAFSCTAAALALMLLAVDSLLFCEDLGVIEQVAFLAVSCIGILMMRPRQRAQMELKKVSVTPVTPEVPKTRRLKRHGSERPLPSNRSDSAPSSATKSLGVPLSKSVEEEIETALARVQQVVSACQSSSMALAEARVVQLLRSGTLDSLANLKADEGSPRSRQLGQLSIQMHCMLQACIDAGDPLRAAAWASMLLEKSYCPGTSAMQAVMSALVQKKKHIQPAERFFSKVLALNGAISVDCLHLLFEFCIAPADVAKIEELLNKCAARSHQELAWCFLAVLRTEIHTSSGMSIDYWMNRAIKANAVCSIGLYDAAIHACARIGDVETAKYWLNHAVSESNLQMDSATYSGMVLTHLRRGQTAEAESLLAWMVGNGARQYLPDVDQINGMTDFCLEREDLSGAQLVLNVAKERLPFQHLPHKDLREAAIRLGDLATAEYWLQVAAKEGVERDPASYNVLITAYGKAGDTAGAERVLNLMLDQNVEPDAVTISVAVHAAGKSGNQEKAEAMFDLIMARGKLRNLDAIGFNALINSAAKAGDTERAEFWLSKMLEVGVEPSVVSYTTVLHAYARSGNIEKTEMGLERMRKHGIKANVVSYGALIQACVKAGDSQRAEKWFEAMREDEVLPNAVCYSTLINTCAKAGDYERAEYWLRQMYKDGVRPTEVCFNNVIDACAKADYPERAEAWLWRLAGTESFEATHEEDEADSRKKTWHNLVPTRQSFTSAAQAWAKMGRYKEVERLFDRMKDYNIEPDDYSLTVLLGAYARSGQRHRQRSEDAFCTYCANHGQITRPPVRVLKSILGGAHVDWLLKELSLKVVDGPELKMIKPSAKKISKKVQARKCELTTAECGKK